MKKHFNEYFAKVVLESCFPQKFDILEISDKPDLRHFVSGTGIEVTYSMPKKEAEAVNVWHRLYNGKSKNCGKDIERLSQLGIEYDSKSFVWDQGCYDGIKEFFDAVAQKVERLNSKNAEYANMAREVLPYVPDAKWFWEENLGAKKPVIKIGAEIPFTRYFYKYTQPEKSEVLEQKFLTLEKSVSERIKNLFGGK